MDETSIARDARPPEFLVRTMNPVMRSVLRTPLGRLARPFALVEFTGRRSGRQYRVPVGYHQLGRGHVVVTPAPWRANFRNPHPVVVYFRGHRDERVGHLVDDPEAVATTLRELAKRDGSLKRIGVDLPDGHIINATDVTAVDRALIEFGPSD